MQKKKKAIIIAVIAAVIIILAAVIIIYFFKNSDGDSSGEKAYVSKVSEIVNQQTAGLFNRYTGVIEPQETLNIKKSTDKTVREVLVKEGDSVSVGTPLFTYDTDEINLKLNQAILDLEGFGNEINSLYTQIAALEKEKRSASADEQLSYTTQIQEKQNDARRAEYNKKSKQVEIEQIKKSLANATVTSEIEGVVKSVNQNGGYDDMTGEELPFMTILATGNYRVKGKINETNAWSLPEGTPVIIRSRIDENQTWSGTVSKIDFENQVQNNNNYYYMGSDSGNQSTNYPFYVELESSSGLMLGQHVFIEPDNGQMTQKEGLWLMESYLVTEGNDAFVWVMNRSEKLEKRKLDVGDYDSEMMEYEILGGLEETDCIAWPTSVLKEGMPCMVSSVSDMMQKNMEAEMNQMNGEEGTDGAGMDGADMNGADMDGTDMNGADMNGADMDGADMSGADMDGADMDGADMDGADMDGDGSMDDADMDASPASESKS